MFLIQILVPLADNEGKKFPAQKFGRLKNLLIKKFSGLTIFSHSPAEGLWRKPAANVLKEQIIVFEIMTPTKEMEWWRDLRARLEKEFEQECIVIRIFTIDNV